MVAMVRSLVSGILRVINILCVGGQVLDLRSESSEPIMLDEQNIDFFAAGSPGRETRERKEERTTRP